MGLVALLCLQPALDHPEDIYEAARIDGAVLGITLPFTLHYCAHIRFCARQSIIGSFQVFDTIAVTTLGWPGLPTRHRLVASIRRLVFVDKKKKKKKKKKNRMGYASTLSCALCLCSRRPPSSDA